MFSSLILWPDLQSLLLFYLSNLDSKIQHFNYFCTATAAAASLQSCPTLCDPIDGSPPGSAVPGILQARTLEGVAISFSNALKWKVKGKSFGRLRLLATSWTAAHQAPPPMGFSSQEYSSGLPLVLLSFNYIVLTNIIQDNFSCPPTQEMLRVPGVGVQDICPVWSLLKVMVT